MPRRAALLIANRQFRPDSGLLPLRGGPNDSNALCSALGDPNRGGFDLRTFFNRNSHEIKTAIREELDAAGPGDLVLIHYTGFGKIDACGTLCLATSDTISDALPATSIPADHIRACLTGSGAGTGFGAGEVVLVLDCYFSAASAEAKGLLESQLTALGDGGRLSVLAGSGRVQSVGELEGGSVDIGDFTACVLEGIDTGAADRDEDGCISLDDLFQYVRQIPRHQPVRLFGAAGGGSPMISRCPATAVRREAAREQQMSEEAAAQHWQQNLRRLQGEATARRLVEEVAARQRQEDLRRQQEEAVARRRETGLRRLRWGAGVALAAVAVAVLAGALFLYSRLSAGVF